MSVASTVSGLLSGLLLAIRSVGFSLSEIPVSASIRVSPPALRRMWETKCGGIGSPVRGSIWRPELFGWRLLICSDLASPDGRKRICPRVPPATALGGAEHPPLAFTHVVRISRLPSIFYDTARLEGT